jgi:hypothetical protein
MSFKISKCFDPTETDTYVSFDDDNGKERLKNLSEVLAIRILRCWGMQRSG